MSHPDTDPAEIEKFAAHADEWWDPEGPLKTLHQINPLRVRYVRSHVPVHNAQVLDIGCGGGLFAEALAAEGARITGIDMAEASIDVARRHAENNVASVRYECIEMADFAAQHAGEFDIVSCFELLEHLPDPAGAVAACCDALKPGGTAFFSTLNRNPKSFMLAIVTAEHLLHWIPRGTHEYLRFVRPSELAGWCRSTGLDIRTLTGLHFNPLTGDYTLGGNVDVNYFAHAVKPPA